jgi:hypothetical protein
MLALNMGTHIRTYTGRITLKTELLILLANLNLIPKSALPMSPSIAINPVPSTEILNTMAIEHREILRLRP